jgi:hypothetical protein
MATLASIPDCVAAHVLNDASEAVELARGTLVLIEVSHHKQVPAPVPPAGGKEKHPKGVSNTADSQETFVNPDSDIGKDKDGISTMSTVGLVLEVGESAFPLRVNTLFGRLAEDPRVYLFSPEMHINYSRTARLYFTPLTHRPSENAAPENKESDYFGDYRLTNAEKEPFADDSASTLLPEGGYIRVTLPEGVLVAGSELRERQREFEEALVRYGLLKPHSSAFAKLKNLAKKCVCCT